MNNPHRNKFFGGEVDWFTVLLWLLLCIIGWFNIHAAVFDPEHPGLFSMETNYGKQSIYIFSAMLLQSSYSLWMPSFTALSPPYYTSSPSCCWLRCSSWGAMWVGTRHGFP